MYNPNNKTREFSNKEITAMCIAALQIVMPYFLAIMGILATIILLFQIFYV